MVIYLKKIFPNIPKIYLLKKYKGLMPFKNRISE